MRIWLVLLSTCTLIGQERVVDRSAIWVDTAQRGDMTVMLRAPGVALADGAVELHVPASQTSRLAAGQDVIVSLLPGVAKGKIVGLGKEVVRGQSPVRVAMEAGPSGLQPGQAVDGSIQLSQLADVTHVGRPVTCEPGMEGTIFKLEPDGQSARKVKVLYGQASINALEIRQGLQSGDRVILSDMSEFKSEERVRLR